MRLLALLRLVGGKDFWKSVRAASRWCFGRHVGTSQIIRSGTRSGATPVPYPGSVPPFHIPVPYPRSIPVWRIRSIPLFHTSLPYLRSIPHDNLLNLYAYTWAYIHTWVHTCACSTYNCYLLCCVMVGMYLAIASWQFNNYLLRCSCSQLPILIKMCYLVAVLWSGPFCSRPRSIPVPYPF